MVQLRPLFVMILKECSPVEPLVLWDEYKLYICDDLHHHLIQLQFEQPTEDLIYDYGLYLIEEALQESGKSLKDYAPMPMSVNNWNAIVGNQLIAEQHNYNAVQERQSAAFDVAKMNRGQKHAFDSVYMCMRILSVTFARILFLLSYQQKQILSYGMRLQCRIGLLLKRWIGLCKMF